MDIALVHGSYHGAWCWDFLRPELERLGHRVATVDLPISDPTHGAADYAAAVEAAIDGALGPASVPVVVGHSMAGLIIPVVASHRPVARLVFLAAFLPVPGRSANDQRAHERIDGQLPPKIAQWTDLGDDVWMVGPRTATELFYHDAPAAVARWATQRLRPQSYRILQEVTPLEAWPDVERSSIVCRDDRAINPVWVRAASKDRLGVEPIELEGGHSPFLTRPADLARIIDALA
ncbi:MAG: alpha/beta fold hydrolase [Candidatus Limnocylindrales bacterium]